MRDANGRGAREQHSGEREPECAGDAAAAGSAAVGAATARGQRRGPSPERSDAAAVQTSRFDGRFLAKSATFPEISPSRGPIYPFFVRRAPASRNHAKNARLWPAETQALPRASSTAEWKSARFCHSRGPFRCRNPPPLRPRPRASRASAPRRAAGYGATHPHAPMLTAPQSATPYAAIAGADGRAPGRTRGRTDNATAAEGPSPERSDAAAAWTSPSGGRFLAKSATFPEISPSRGPISPVFVRRSNFP